MTILHSSLDAETGLAPRASVPQHWQAAPSETQALWQSAFDAAQGDDATEQPMDLNVAAVDAHGAVAAPSAALLATTRVDSVAASMSTGGRDSTDELILTRDQLLATTALATLLPQLAPDAGVVSDASASLMDGFATFTTSSPTAHGNGAPARVDHAAPPVLAPADATRTAAAMVALAPPSVPMAPTRIDAHVASSAPTRWAADLARNQQPVAAEFVGVRRLLALNEAQTDLQEESVLVLQRAHGIEIVVRHAALAPQAAVSCALATAQHLAGDRKALQQVTLNGRTVYDNPSQPTPAKPMRPQRTLLFSC
jgi:hypothetical protein